MIERFENDEDRYLSWAEANPLGYILNVGKPDYKPRYPMVHAVRHALWTSKRESGTRGHYIKVCSGSLAELEHWAQENFRRPLSHCRCMLDAQPSAAWKTAVPVTDVTGVEIAFQGDSASVDAPNEGRYLMDAEEPLRRFPGAQPIEGTREVHDLPENPAE